MTLTIQKMNQNTDVIEQAVNAFAKNMTEKIVDEAAVIHIIGAFSAGKSRLVRELLRKHKTATHFLPISSQERQTALPLEITYGETPNLIQFETNSPEKFTQLSHFPTREIQMRFDVTAHQLRLEIPEPSLLLGNVSLCSAEEGIKRLFLKDMPGWNSGDSFVAEDPLANGLVGADNISLVYVVRANAVDSQDDLARLIAIFEAVDSGDAFFYNGFNLVVVVTRCEDNHEHEAIKKRLSERLQNLAEKIGSEDDFTLTVLCVEFGKENDVLNHESFNDAFWQAVLLPIAAEKQAAPASDWSNRLQQPDLLIQSKLAHGLDLLKKAEQFVTNFKKQDEFVANMNSTRLLGLSKDERRLKVHGAWVKQVGLWQSWPVINDLQLPENHPLSAWWNEYWLKNLLIMLKKVNALAINMDKAINDLPLEATNIQGYFYNSIETLYGEAAELLGGHFYCFCEAIEPLRIETNNAKMIATLLSLSIIDAKYSDYYQSLKTQK